MTTPAEMTHPAARAVHAVHNALQIVIGMRDSTVESDGERIRELLSPVPEDIAALHQDNEAKAAELAEQREEMCAMARTIAELEAAALTFEQLDTKRVLKISALKKQLAEAQHTVEELVREFAPIVGTMSSLFTRARNIRVYEPEPQTAQAAINVTLGLTAAAVPAHIVPLPRSAASAGER